MQGFSRLLALGACSAVALAIAVPSHAATFASFTMASSRDNIKWTKTGGTSGSLDSTLPNGTLGNANVRFNFLDPLLGISNAKALFSMSAAGGGAAAGGGGAVGSPLDQGGLGGTFKFVYNGPAYVDGLGNAHATGDILLQGVFTLADI